MDEFIKDATKLPPQGTAKSTIKRQAPVDPLDTLLRVFRSKNNSTGRRRYPERSAEFFGRLQRQQKALLLDFYGESEVLSHLRHPNITLFFGAVRFPLYCIVTEYVPCGSLFDLLHRHHRKLSLSQIVRVSKELASTLAYLHSKDLIHCDLKSSNILLTEIGKRCFDHVVHLWSGSVKICDFGLATFLSQELDYTYNENGTDVYIPTRQKRDHFVGNECPAMLGCVGTHQWMAPEVMRGEASTKASDVYSFGVILWEMLTRTIPYKDMLSTHITAWVGYGGHNPHDGAIEEIWKTQSFLAANLNSDTIEECEQVMYECCEATLVVKDEARLPVARIPKPLGVMLFRCLNRNPEDRPSSVELSEFFSALHRSAVIDIEENLKTFFGF